MRCDELLLPWPAARRPATSPINATTSFESLGRAEGDWAAAASGLSSAFFLLGITQSFLGALLQTLGLRIDAPLLSVFVAVCKYNEHLSRPTNDV